MIESICGYTFNNPELLAEALTHRSWSEEGGKGPHNERLELLGDAVLELLVTELLLELLPTSSEGNLSEIRAALVREEALAELGRAWELGPQLRLGRGEEKSGGRNRPSLLANAVEAVLAAIFREAGLDEVRKIMREPLTMRVQAMPQGGWRDAKSVLQELSMKKWKRLPQYEFLRQDGEDHHPTFHYRVSVGPTDGVVVSAEGLGGSRQAAQRAAATEALRELRDKGIQ